MRYGLIALLLVGMVGCAGMGAQATQEERTEYIENNRRPAEIEEALRNGEVVVGMLKREVRMVKGRPFTSEGNEWCYREDGERTCYYFDGDRVDRIN